MATGKVSAVIKEHEGMQKQQAYITSKILNFLL
jgi:hypothetical protein